MPSSASAAKVVLLAADTAFARDRFKGALEQAGHKVIPISSAVELLARVSADQGDVDLVMVDLRLSNSVGTELAAAIRKIDDGRLPLLVFSGSVYSASDVRELARLRVSGYINEHCASQQILPAVSPHLFPDSFNRRRHPRVILGVSIHYRVGQTIAAALTLNLSHGGVGIRTASPVGAGTRAHVRFKLPGSEADIDAVGRVAWYDRRGGMGIRFEAVDPDAQALIDSVVDAHSLSARDN